MALEERLHRLLASVVEREADYVLARLELSWRHPQAEVPPILPRLADASESALRSRWDEVERGLEEVGRFVRRIDGDRRISTRSDPAFLRLRRTYRELDHHARALRWVLTVTERTTDESE
jgi:hypothetical protein